VWGMKEKPMLFGGEMVKEKLDRRIRYQQRQAEQGLCRQCPNELDGGGVLCRECRERKREGRGFQRWKKGGRGRPPRGEG